MQYSTRLATKRDLPAITMIYNQGIEDRIATLETALKTEGEIETWFLSRDQKHKVLVIEDGKENVFGWASLNVFNSKCCYRGVSDISIYIRRDMRCKGAGKILLTYLINTAREQGFSKLVLSMSSTNLIAKKLYLSLGFREVGVYKNHGILDGKWMDIVIMENILSTGLPCCCIG